MGVYINMEMPKNGSCIQIVIDDDGKVYPSVEKCILKMGSIAKAFPVLSHGRLIDADVFKQYYQTGLEDIVGLLHDGYKAFAEELTASILQDIDEQPTIIPADDPKEEE